jgi:hypothetical protein
VHKIRKLLTIIFLAPIGVFFGVILIVGSLPIIAFFLAYQLYLKVIERLRGDPRVKLERLVAKDYVEHTQTLENALAYFEALVAEISKRSGASVGELKKAILDSDDDYDQYYNRKLLTYERVCTTPHAQVAIKLEVAELTDKDGEVSYAGFRDDEDPELAARIEAFVTLTTQPEVDPVYVQLEFDGMGTYFCIGLLQGEGRYNSNTGQLWSYLSEQEVWMVRYNPEGRDFGFRKSFLAGLAREKWFDATV